MTTPILWIHGWGMSPAVWERQMAALPQYEHHCVSFAGCGRIGDLRAAVSAPLHRRRGPWILIGWSMGALLALEAAFSACSAQHAGPGGAEAQSAEPSAEAEPGGAGARSVEPAELPAEAGPGGVGAQSAEPAARGRVSAVMVVGGTLCFVGKGRASGWPRKLVERMSRQVGLHREAALRQFRESMFSPTERGDARYADWMREVGATDFSEAGLQAGLNYLMETDLRDDWDRLASACSLQIGWIHGGEDAVCSPSAIPKTGLDSDHTAIFDQTGHVPFVTQPNRFHEQVRRFLNAENNGRAAD